jgi:predicted nucleotidyltransferase
LNNDFSQHFHRIVRKKIHSNGLIKQNTILRGTYVDKSSVLEIIALFKNALEAQKIKINNIILFGSFSKNNFNEECDINLAILSDDFAGKGYWERINILSEAIYEVYKPIEAIAMTPEEWEKRDSIIVDYAEKGEIVYAA